MRINQYWRNHDSRHLVGTRHADGTAVLFGIIAVVALSGLAFQPGLAADEAMMMLSDTQPRFDKDSIESRVQTVVVETLMLYWANGADAFDMITPDDVSDTDVAYPFILNATTLETVANGAYDNFAGVRLDTLAETGSSLEQVMADLHRNGGTWVEYMASNPDNGLVQLKRSWLYLHDGYIFGSGHYLPESRVKYVVEDAVRLFKSEGVRAFDIITPDVEVDTPTHLIGLEEGRATGLGGNVAVHSSDLYPFVLNATDWATVAHATIPSRVGTCCSYAIQHGGDRLIEVIIEDLHRDKGTWVEYVFINPATDTIQLKRTWLYMYGDYIFGSGYYMQDSGVQSLVDEAIQMYTSRGADAFNAITPAEPVTTSGSYPFVMDAESLKVEAHGAFPHLVGTHSQYFDAADKSLKDILDELDDYGEAWVTYVSVNPGTSTDQLTRTYLQAHDGHIFGAGYSLPDSRALSKVNEAIYTYRSNPDPAFADINAGALDELGLAPLVTNSTHIVASGKLPVVGVEFGSGNVQNVEDAFVIFTIPLHEHIRLALESDGQEYWYREIGVSAYHGMSLINNYVARSYDGFVFVANYFVAEGDVQSLVDLAIFSYDNSGRASFDAITPDESVATDKNYLFVLNATTLEVVAYGVSPDVVGTTYDSIRDTSIRPFDEVLSDMETNGYAWILHTAINPLTGKEQLKQSLLQHRDGYIFGAGYYILDASTRDTPSYLILLYNHDPSLSIPSFGPDWVTFAVDPHTGLSLNENDKPAPWESITAKIPSSEILQVLEKEPGMWVTYQAVHPVNDVEESVRVWITLHDGYVFGTGFYESVRGPNPNAFG